MEIETTTTADGTEYITFLYLEYTVDEIIELLEKHRGKMFYSGALENPCLQITDKCVQLEEREYFEDLVDKTEEDF